jgi:hypothetical protein
MNVELFQFLAYQAGLRLEDLHILTVGMVLDYIKEYVDQRNPKKVRRRRATQQDFDSF